MNGKVCCILGVCCIPGSAEQIEALADELSAAGVGGNDASDTAAWIVKHFDLAPPGTLTEFKAGIAKMARKGRGAES